MIAPENVIRREAYLENSPGFWGLKAQLFQPFGENC
jgi:hypothetical protein